jgi:hypothetical protein
LTWPPRELFLRTAGKQPARRAMHEALLERSKLVATAEARQQK